MRKMLSLSVLLVCAGLVWGQGSEPEAEAPAVPDLSSFDRDTLQALCENLYKRVAELEQEVAGLQSQLVVAHGGTVEGGGAAGEVVVIDQGSWTLRVVSNPEPDVAPLLAQIAVHREKLTASVTGVDARLVKVRDTLARMERAEESYYDDGKFKTRNPNSSRDLSQARARVRQVENEKRGVQMRVHDLEQRVKAMRNTRRITAELDDGKQVELLARGVHAALGATLQPGRWYQVSGRAEFSGASGTIFPRAAVAAEAPTGDEEISSKLPQGG